MAPRANWKGFLKLSLVSCSIALFPATSTRERIRFNLINRETGNRIRYRQVDAETGEHVRVSIGARERQRYRETLMRLAHEIRFFCSRTGLHYALYTTDREFHDFFLHAAANLGLVH